MAAKVFQGGTAGGNWNNNANWVGGAFAVAGDTVTFTGSNPCIVNVASACTSIDFTGWSNTFTITNAITLTVAGNVTLSSTMTYATSTGILAISSTATIITNGKSIGSTLNFTGAGVTYTIGGGFDCTVLGLLGSSVGTYIIVNSATTEKIYASGSINISCGGSSIGWGGTAPIIANGSGQIYGTGTGTFFSTSLTINTSGSYQLGGSSSTYTLGVGFGGSLIYTAGTISYYGSATNIITYQGGNATISLNGLTIPTMNLTMTGTYTLTLNAPLTVTAVNFSGNGGNGTFTIGGSYGFTFGSVTTNGATNLGGIVLTYGNTYVINTSFTWINYTASGNIPTIKSSSAGNKVSLTLANGASCALMGVKFTDVDASNGRTITTFNGTVSNTSNIISFNDLGTCVSGCAN